MIIVMIRCCKLCQLILLFICTGFYNILPGDLSESVTKPSLGQCTKHHVLLVNTKKKCGCQNGCTCHRETVGRVERTQAKASYLHVVLKFMCD